MRPSIIEAAKVGAVVNGDGSNGAMLRQGDGGFVGDLGFRGRRVDDEDQRLAGAVAEIDRRADGAEIVRARTGRNDDQLGNGDDALDGHGDGRRSVDDREAEALLAKNLEVGSKPRDGRLRKGGHFCLALVPPVGKTALRVDVDQTDRACPRQLRLHRKMSGQGRLTRPALLRCHSQNAHAFPLAEFRQFSSGSDTQGAKIWLTHSRHCCCIPAPSYGRTQREVEACSQGSGANFCSARRFCSRHPRPLRA